MEKYQFKPFEQVLVRDSDQCIWKAGIYSHYEKASTMPYVCTGSYYAQCIPYNEETAHLLGTTNAYNPPQPKQYRITWVEKDLPCKTDCTEEEFKNFIETAVLHNKDIQNFNVRKI